MNENNAEVDKKIVEKESASPSSEKCDKICKGDKNEAEHHGCQHATQCIVRQPYPPYSPFLVHDGSKYHLHMMNKTVEDLTGCIKCFSVDKCTWLKWWFKWQRDQHGFPDIDPSVYKKYL